MEEKNGKLSVVTAPEKDGHSREKKSFWYIDRRMLPFKIHFFLFIGGMGAILPFLSAIGITKLGFTASNIAAAYTGQQFVFIVLKPGIGYLADYFNKLKATIVGLTILQAIFSLFMLMIPSADIQHTVESQSSISVNSNHYCHFCSNTDEFKNLSLMQPPDEGILRQVLHCFQDFDTYKNKYDEVYCAKEDSSSLNIANISYRILEITCEDTLSKISFPSSTQHSLYSGDVLFITQSFGSLQNASILCLPSKGTTLFKDNLSYSRTKQYCHAVPNSEVADALLTKPYNTTNCQDYESNSHDTQNYEQNAALSAANFKSWQFWVYTLCLILSCTCISSIFTMSDTACYETVQGADYGIQRAFGAISWGLVAPFAGFLNDYTGSYFCSWIVMALFCSLQIWNLSRMNLVKPDFSQSILKDLKSVFSSMEFLAFELGVLLNGIFTGIIWFYLTWFLISIGGNKLVIGLAHTMQCFLGEVPIMFVSGWLIKKFGHFNLVSLALFCHAVRFFIYSYLHNPWLVLPIESLHGFTFGSFYSAMTSYGKLNSKPGTEATTQSVLCSTYEALGAGLGCLMSGVCFDYYGSHTTFFYASFICFAATAVNIGFTILIDCRKGGLDITKKLTSYSERY